MNRTTKRRINKNTRKVAKKMVGLSADQIQKMLNAMIVGTYEADLDYFLRLAATVDGIGPKTIEKLREVIESEKKRVPQLHRSVDR